MKKTFLCLMSLCSVVFLNAEEEPQEEKPDIEELSQAFGHMIGQNLESLGFDFDMDQVLKGLQDSIAGKASPLTEAQTVEAITHIQEEAFTRESDQNLTEAVAFLAKNALSASIVALEDNKLQYTIEQEGTGAAVEPHFSPLIRYTGRFLDGKEFGASQEDEVVDLDETIAGFAKGLIGMKEGEKRTLYIHPDLGYGVSGFLPPNSLLVFDVELIKANAPQEEQEHLDSLEDDSIENEEIAFSEFSNEHAPTIR